MTLFRFSTRDLLWLMVVAACLLGWWVDHGDMQHQLSYFKSQLNLLGDAAYEAGYGIDSSEGLKWKLVPTPKKP